MNREIKFRAWHKGVEQMLYDVKHGDCFKWLNEGQPLEVMQFTGLKDKNGVDIYEGCICHTYTIGIGNLNEVVVFERGSFCFQHPMNLTIELRGFKTDYIEVIGNIYESPNLLL